MKNKVMIKLIVPELNDTFDIFIPVNDVVWKVKRLILKAVYDLSYDTLDVSNDYFLVNKDNGKMYLNNDIIINTDIRNGTELVLFSK